MKRCKLTEPSALYRECWEYVVACLMERNRHLRREEAEDIASQSFLELMLRGEADIRLWIWRGHRRAWDNYHQQYLRYMPCGTQGDILGSRLTEPDLCEVFHPGQLLRRKDAKAAFALMMQGYNRAEVAEMLGRHPQGVTTMMKRLRDKCKEYLKGDIKIYRNRQF